MVRIDLSRFPTIMPSSLSNNIGEPKIWKLLDISGELLDFKNSCLILNYLSSKMIIEGVASSKQSTLKNLFPLVNPFFHIYIENCISFCKHEKVDARNGILLP